MKPIKFAFEDEEVFEGFHNGYWNGWLCPLVTEEVHKRLCEYMDADDLTEEQRESLNEYVNQEPNSQVLYDWGYCYCWDEVKEDEEELDDEGY